MNVNALMGASGTGIAKPVRSTTGKTVPAQTAGRPEMKAAKNNCFFCKKY